MEQIGQTDNQLLTIRRPHSSYQRVVQGKCPLNFLNLNGVVCSNTLFSNTSALTSSLLFWGNSTCKILEHLEQTFCRHRVAFPYHLTDNYYIASRYFSELITFDELLTSIMVCEIISWRCKSGRCMPSCLPSGWDSAITLHQSFGVSFCANVM